MRKVTLILCLLIFTGLMFVKAQEDIELKHRHEVKLNIGSSIFISSPEVSYEYILREYFSVGAAIAFGLQTDELDVYSFKFTPFARWFFGDSFRERKNAATGFFLEGNSVIGTQEIYMPYQNTGSTREWVSNYESKFTAGLGLALGCKFLSRKNWATEIFGGLGHNFIYYDEFDEFGATSWNQILYPRIGISIGKRF